MFTLRIEKDQIPSERLHHSSLLPINLDLALIRKFEHRVIYQAAAGDTTNPSGGFQVRLRSCSVPGYLRCRVVEQAVGSSVEKTLQNSGSGRGTNLYLRCFRSIAYCKCLTVVPE